MKRQIFLFLFLVFVSIIYILSDSVFLFDTIETNDSNIVQHHQIATDSNQPPSTPSFRFNATLARPSRLPASYTSPVDHHSINTTATPPSPRTTDFFQQTGTYDKHWHNNPDNDGRSKHSNSNSNNKTRRAMSIFGPKQFVLQLDSAPEEHNLTALAQQHLHVNNSGSLCGPFSFNERFLKYVVPSSNCAGEGHQLYEFACSLGEAHFLNRTLVIPNQFCIGSAHLKSSHDDYSTTFEYYYDFGELLSRGLKVTTMESLDVLLKNKCLYGITERKMKHVPPKEFTVKASRVAPEELPLSSTIVTRDFTGKDVDYLERQAYSVCHRFHSFSSIWPWPAFNLRQAAFKLLSKLGDDFYSLHVRRGDKAKRVLQFPTLDQDTRPSNILVRLKDKIPFNSTVYLITDERHPEEFFQPLHSHWRVVYTLQFSKLLRKFRVHNGYQIFKVEKMVCASNPRQRANAPQRHFETFYDLTDAPRHGTGKFHGKHAEEGDNVVYAGRAEFFEPRAPLQAPSSAPLLEKDIAAWLSVPNIVSSADRKAIKN